MNPTNDYINNAPGDPVVHVYLNERGSYDIVLNIDGGYGLYPDAERVAKERVQQMRALGLNVTYDPQ